MNYIPDWLWQNLVADFVRDSLVAAAWLAWKYRRTISNAVTATPQSDVIHVASGGPAMPRSGTPMMRVSKDAPLRWRVEAPTPSLVRRFEELDRCTE